MNQITPEGRLLSIDLFRGVVMFLLIGGVTGIYDLLLASRFEGTLIYALGLQFQHHPWNGLTLWDLGHPFFLFISGAAMGFLFTMTFGIQFTVSRFAKLRSSWMFSARPSRPTPRRPRHRGPKIWLAPMSGPFSASRITLRTGREASRHLSSENGCHTRAREHMPQAN